MKVPEKFAPDVPSSQANVSAKRKRGGEDIEKDASDVEEEDEESDESTEEEEEAPTHRKKSKAPRKPAAKKPKVNGNASRERAPAVKLPSRPKGKKVAIADRNAGGLYGKRLCNRES